MKTFHCTNCQNLVFFENIKCLSCGRALAFLPDRLTMGALAQDSAGLWRPEGLGRPEDSPAYRLCANFDQVSVCNWVVSADDPEGLCRSCR